MKTNDPVELKITNKAVSAVVESLLEEGLTTADTRLRIDANSGGCSGWRWELESESKSQQKETDKIFLSGVEGLELIVDEKLLHNVIGPVTIDFDTKNLVEQGFVFIRNQGQQCGCGESFTPILEDH